MNWFSRRFEYAADKQAADFTREPEAIRARANLYQSDELPGRPGPRSELFMTHPTLVRRIGAIASGRHVPANRLASILVDERMVDAGVFSLASLLLLENERLSTTFRLNLILMAK